MTHDDRARLRAIRRVISAVILISATATLQHIDLARLSHVAGVVLFSYDALITPPNSATSLSALARAAFGAGSH